MTARTLRPLRRILQHHRRAPLLLPQPRSLHDELTQLGCQLAVCRMPDMEGVQASDVGEADGFETREFAPQHVRRHLRTPTPTRPSGQRAVRQGHSSKTEV